MSQSETEARAAHNKRAEDATRQYRGIRSRLTLSSVVAVISILGTVSVVGRYVLTPWFVVVATDTLGAEIDNRIDDRTQPIKNGVKSMLKSKIEELEGEVDLMEARYRRDPAKWTDLDSMKLTQIKNRLANARTALAQFENPPIAVRK
jgi:hypothetical protein